MANCVIQTQKHFAFDTVVTDVGTVVADQSNDTLTLTSSDASLLITGTAGTDTIDFTVASSIYTGEWHLPFFADAAGTVVT